MFHTPTTYPGQGVAQEVRRGLVGTLTYALRACSAAAVECSKATLAAKAEIYMTFEFYGWIIEYYYVFSRISPGHGNSGSGRPESRGKDFKKVTNPV